MKNLCVMHQISIFVIHVHQINEYFSQSMRTKHQQAVYLLGVPGASFIYTFQAMHWLGWINMKWWDVIINLCDNFNSSLAHIYALTYHQLPLTVVTCPCCTLKLTTCMLVTSPRVNWTQYAFSWLTNIQELRSHPIVYWTNVQCITHIYTQIVYPEIAVESEMRETLKVHDAQT